MAAALAGCECDLCDKADAAVAQRSSDRDVFMVSGWQMAWSWSLMVRGGSSDIR